MAAKRMKRAKSREAWALVYRGRLAIFDGRPLLFTAKKAAARAQSVVERLARVRIVEVAPRKRKVKP